MKCNFGWKGKKGNLILYQMNNLLQLTLPGIDEEIMFRRILLGLLMSSSENKIIKFIGSPAVLITSILFGLIHVFTLSKDYSINFNLIYFLQTAFTGYIRG